MIDAFPSSSPSLEATLPYRQADEHSNHQYDNTRPAFGDLDAGLKAAFTRPAVSSQGLSHGARMDICLSSSFQPASSTPQQGFANLSSSLSAALKPRAPLPSARLRGPSPGFARMSDSLTAALRRGKAKAPSPPVEREEEPVETSSSAAAAGHRYQNAQFGYNGENVNVRPYAIAVHTFVPQFDNELGFREGDMVFLTRHVEADWLEGEADGHTGIFPKSYINIVVDVSPKSSLEDLEFLSLELNTTTTTSAFLQPGAMHQVAFTFSAEAETDLSVTAGEEVVVVLHTEENWALVRNLEGRQGQCPVNHLNPLPEPSQVLQGREDQFLSVAWGGSQARPSHHLKFFDPLCSPDEEMLKIETELIRRVTEKPDIPVNHGLTLHKNINLPSLNGERPRHRFKSSSMGKEQSIESFITLNLDGLREIRNESRVAPPSNHPPASLAPFQPDFCPAAQHKQTFQISDSVREELMANKTKCEPPPRPAHGPPRALGNGASSRRALEEVYEDPDDSPSEELLDPPIPTFEPHFHRPSDLESLYAKVNKNYPKRSPAVSPRLDDSELPSPKLLPSSPSDSSCIIYEELPSSVSASQTVTVQINYAPEAGNQEGAVLEQEAVADREEEIFTPTRSTPESPPSSPPIPKRTTSIFQRFQEALSRGDTFKSYISEFPPDQEAILPEEERVDRRELPPRPSTTPLRTRSVFYNSVLSERGTPSLPPSLSHSYETLNGSELAAESYRRPHRPAPAPPGEEGGRSLPRAPLPGANSDCWQYKISCPPGQKRICMLNSRISIRIHSYHKEI